MFVTIEADFHNPAHAAAILDLLDTYSRDPMGAGTPLPPRVYEGLIPALQQRPHALAVLVMDDDKPAALALCFEGFSSFECAPLINIHDLVVAPAYRGHGLSLRLLEGVEAAARARGCCKLTLEVLEGNTTAQAAYRRFGFAGYELDPKLGRAMFWQKKL